MSHESPRQDPLRQVVRGSALSGAGAFVAAVGGVGLTLVVARLWAPDLAGVFFASTALFVIVSSLTVLGTDVGLVRFLAAQSVTGRPHELTATLRIALGPVLAASTVAGIALWFLAPRIAGAIGSPDVAADTTAMLRALAPFVPVSSAYTALLAATRGRGNVRHTVYVDSMFRTIAQPILFAAVVVPGGGPALAAVAWAIPYLVGVLVCVRVLRRRAARASLGQDPGALPSARAGSTAEFWRFTAARAAAGAVFLVWRRFDVLLVAAIAGPADAAVYTAATRFLVIGSLGVQAVQMTMSPQLSKQFAVDDVAGAGRIYRVTTGWTMMFAWPIYLSTAAAVGLVIGVFGSGYEAGTSSVVVLSLATLVATACGSVDSVLLMSGRSLLSLGNGIVTLATNVLLDLWLVPEIGIIGAAIGWAVAICVRNLLGLVQINRLMGMWPFTRPALAVAVVSTACFALVPAVLTWTGAPDVALVLSLVVGALVYVCWLVRARRFLQLDHLVSALRRRR